MKRQLLINLFLGKILLLSMAACIHFKEPAPGEGERENLSSMEANSRPYARYWWFASEIKMEDIRYNLNWLAENGFGGVEIAWVYPLNAMNKQLDQTYSPRQQWLSDEWQQMVAYAMFYADSIGLACDLTMGTLWPFGDTGVTWQEASQTYGTDKRQQITRSWEYPAIGYVVDHLAPDHYHTYFNRIIQAFPRPQLRQPAAWFIDSWEVDAEKLWYSGLEQDFRMQYEYDIVPYMDSLYQAEYRHQLYDYRRLISSKVIDFYTSFDSVLNAKNMVSRGQCSGAPCDIISAYARLDVPEGEALLYRPEYNRIPASAATLSGKRVVSAESFTCLYGWPAHHIRKEQTADLKMVADALFSNGVNHIVWHGKPHNPENLDSVSFYASVHLGKEGSLADELPAFNRYLELCSRILKKGKNHTGVAVYLPTEDAWIKGMLPPEKQFRWAWGEYEMRYNDIPEEVLGYAPVWINEEFLIHADVEQQRLQVGGNQFHTLYVDAEYLHLNVLQALERLAQQGLPITLKRIPQQAGVVKSEQWRESLPKLMATPNVSQVFNPAERPFIQGAVIPPYWVREDETGAWVFLAHPLTRNISFPLAYGGSAMLEPVSMEIEIFYQGTRYPLRLDFAPQQSLMFRISGGVIEPVDISFYPHKPVLISTPLDTVRPWIVNR